MLFYLLLPFKIVWWIVFGFFYCLFYGFMALIGFGDKIPTPNKMFNIDPEKPPQRLMSSSRHLKYLKTKKYLNKNLFNHPGNYQNDYKDYKASCDNDLMNKYLLDDDDFDPSTGTYFYDAEGESLYDKK